MARGRKAYTLEERLQKINEEIEGTEKILEDMRQEKCEIEDQIHQIHLMKINDLIEESGLSFEEVEELLTNRES